MRAVGTHQFHKVDYYQLALLLAHGQVESLSESWPDFIDRLSHICDSFAHVLSQQSHLASTITAIEAAN